MRQQWSWRQVYKACLLGAGLSWHVTNRNNQIWKNKGWRWRCWKQENSLTSCEKWGLEMNIMSCRERQEVRNSLFERSSNWKSRWDFLIPLRWLGGAVVCSETIHTYFGTGHNSLKSTVFVSGKNPTGHCRKESVINARICAGNMRRKEEWWWQDYRREDEGSAWEWRRNGSEIFKFLKMTGLRGLEEIRITVSGKTRRRK